MLPFLVNLATTAVGSEAAPSITVAINASGVYVDVEESNDPVTPHLVVSESQANASPIFCVPC